MAWTAPRTWVTGETVTAALMNAQIRDNLLEASAATVTTAGDLAFADAANSMGSRVGLGAANSHLVSTGSAPVWRAIATDVDTAAKTLDTGVHGTGYFKLGAAAQWNFTSEIEVTVTTGTRALVLFKTLFSNDTAGARTHMSYSISGATTTAAADTQAISYESSVAVDLAEFGGHDLATVTAGSNVFTLEGRASAGVGTIHRPEITVIGY